MEPMLTLDSALARLLAAARPTDGEEVPLRAALGRVLVEPRVTARDPVPPFDNSAMDGFAARAADLPGTLAVTGEITAGPGIVAPLEPGTTRRIMTGAPMPPGADTVVPIEEAEEGDGVVQLPAAAPGTHVRRVGSDTPAGSEVCLDGTLTPAAIAVLASLGVATVRARRQPTVAVLSTGDELVEPGAALGPGTIYDANAPAIAASVEEAGGIPLMIPRVGDDPLAIEAALHDAAARSDLVVTSGGVSVGRHDHVREILQRRGSLDFWRIAVQPGKPLAVGALGGVTVIGLPGNPVSALVTFELFVRPFIRRLLTLPDSGRLTLPARPESRMAKDRERRAFLRVVLRLADGEVRARSAGGQGSAQLRPMAEANGLLVVPEGEEAALPDRVYSAIVIGALP